MVTDAQQHDEEIEERDIPSVTEKRDTGRKLLPLLGFGAVVSFGLYMVLLGMRGNDGPKSMIPPEPTETYSTGITPRGERVVPDYEIPQVPAQQPQTRQEQRPERGEGRAAEQLRLLQERQRLEMERLRQQRALELENAQRALELQRRQAEAEANAQIQRSLQQRRSAPALIFDESKDQED